MSPWEQAMAAMREDADMKGTARKEAAHDRQDADALRPMAEMNPLKHLVFPPDRPVERVTHVE